MDAVERLNLATAQKYSKTNKIGEGTYAVVYSGTFCLAISIQSLFSRLRLVGTEIATARKVAIKKIKVGQFKDGLDMSAVREVKYLRELHHPNVIEVCILRARHPLTDLIFASGQLLDVFSSKTNLNLVLEFLDADLEIIIKDRTNLFTPADIKSWMVMTLRGLEFCHRNFILHRVCDISRALPSLLTSLRRISNRTICCLPPMVSSRLPILVLHATLQIQEPK